MAEDPTLKGVAMYRRMARQALSHAAQTRNPRMRDQYASAAAVWSSLADDMERFCAAMR